MYVMLHQILNDIINWKFFNRKFKQIISLKSFYSML